MTTSFEHPHAAVKLWSASEARTYHFPYEPLFDRISSENAYWPKWRNTDILAEERRPKRVLFPSWTCPFGQRKLEEFRTMEQVSPEWLLIRNRFLSSSRFGVITGEHPQSWEKAIDFWRESTGRTPGKVFGLRQQGYLDHGKHYEPVARRVYERIMDLPPGSMREEGLRLEMRPPYLYSASPDGIGKGLIEIKCKAVGPCVIKPPPYYLAQIVGAAAIYNKPYSDFVGYWARKDNPTRFMYCARVFTDPLYWERLRLRLDYMAWAILHDRPPTGMLLLKNLYPLPELRIEDLFYYQGTAEEDDAPDELPVVVEMTTS